VRPPTRAPHRRSGGQPGPSVAPERRPGQQPFGRLAAAFAQGSLPARGRVG